MTMPAGDVYKPGMGWRIFKLVIGLAICTSICLIPWGLWMVARALLESASVHRDRLVRRPFSFLFRRSYPLSPETKVGLCVVEHEDEDDYGNVDTTSSRRLVLHTPGQELLAIDVDGWDHEALAASITACTGNPLQRVRWKRSWWSYRYEFASD